MTLSEKERKRESVSEARKDAIQQAMDGGKAIGDISAEERFYNRSLRIRRGVMKWMCDNVNKSFDTLGDMEAQAGNGANCSMVTARRWLYQFSRPGKPFEIVDKGSFYLIRERTELE